MLTMVNLFSLQLTTVDSNSGILSEVVVEHHNQSPCRLYGHASLCVLPTMLEVNCTCFDNVLADSATAKVCQSVKGTLAVSTAVLLRIISGMLM